jgi:hypothetical protein
MKEQANLFWKLTAITFILLACSILFSLILVNNASSSSIYKEILTTDAKIMEISDLSMDADSYYDESSLAYEDMIYSSVESNCRLAREKYTSHAQGIREIIAGIDSSEKIMTIYKDMLTEQVNIDMNMYEACEHFESASRYYAKYYLDSTSADDPSYDMGGSEIDAMNEKIKEHDDAVERYNTLLAEYSVELERITE